MANVTYGYAYATDALTALQAKPLYGYDMGWGFGTCNKSNASPRHDHTALYQSQAIIAHILTWK